MKTLTKVTHSTLALFALASFAFATEMRAFTCQEGCIGVGSSNTALGGDALINVATGLGQDNTAIGYNAMFTLVNGQSNTAVGFKTLYYNTDGSNNTAVGIEPLFNNATGSWNTAIGDFPLYSNTTGNYNTATGSWSLYFNTRGSSNTADGYRALQNSIGDQNTATGYRALGSNTSGDNNIALGFQAGLNLTTGSKNIDIGNPGVTGEANTIRIGTAGTQTETFVAGISGVTVGGGVAVVIDASGQLGTSTSSARYKEAIRPMDEASEAILSLQPVSFRYKKELDPKGIPQFGLVAEDVAKVNPNLVARDDEGKPYTVRYEAVNAMLLNEFLKEHKKVEALEAELQSLKSTVNALDAWRAQRTHESD